MAECERILVADDEASIRKLFELIITMSFPGKIVDKASNGVEAVRLFEEHGHGLILMDLRMPEMDGIQAFRSIKKTCEQKGTRVPPVIFCTGFAPSTDVYEIVGDGKHHGLLKKPVRSEEITSVIRAKLEIAAGVSTGAPDSL